MCEAHEMRRGQELWDDLPNQSCCRSSPGHQRNGLPAAVGLPARPCMALGGAVPLSSTANLEGYSSGYQRPLSCLQAAVVMAGSRGQALSFIVTSSHQAVRGRPVYNPLNLCQDFRCSQACQKSTATLAFCHTVKLPQPVAQQAGG